MTSFLLPIRRDSWATRFAIAAGSETAALLLTHALWSFLRHTPFMLGFGAAIVSSWAGGRWTGLLAVAIGAALYASFPLPLPEDEPDVLLVGFVIISAAFSWIVARRYEIEASLRLSESRLAEAQRLTNIGNWERNIEDGSESWSDQMFCIFGLEPSSFTPSFEAFSRFLHPDDRGLVDSILNRALGDHQPFQCDNRIVRVDGEIRTLHVQGRVALNDDGKVARLIGTAQDITDRKATEEVVNRSERRLQAIIDAEPACVMLVSADGKVLEINRAGFALLGVHDRVEMVGQPIIGWVHPEYRDRYLEMHRAALRGSARRLELRIIGSQGEERWADSHLIPFDTSLSGTDRQRAVLSVNSDISERVRAQQALAEAEERMRFALEASRLGVWETNLKTGVSYWSQTCELLHGLDRGTFGRSFGAFIDCIHLEDRHGVLKEIDEAVREHRDVELEYRTVWPDGTERRISSIGSFFYDDQGLPARGAGISIDITEKRVLEAQLRQSQKMEAVGMLTGGIAHDFNNLLTAIGGYTEMVLETLAEGDKRRDDLQEVAKAAHRAAALTRQLLAVSRRQVLQPTVLDVNGMVADVHKLLRRTIPENIELVLELSQTVATVRADRGQLEQVLLNLAINAGDAMPKGGRLRLATATVEVDASWANRHKPMPASRYVCLTVSDTGAGMTPEIQTHIFEPFFTTKARGKGTGLGLATVYGIVKQSNGFIWLESEVGRGTTFEIYLPVVSERVPSKAQVPPVAEIQGGTQTILIAEDDGAVRRLARDVLASHGYTVLSARDGDEALAVARAYRGRIDLLIADVVMPGLAGRELASQLVRVVPGVRVLYTSGYSAHLMARAGFAEGLPLLPKPFLPADLLRKVSAVLGAAV